MRFVIYGIFLTLWMGMWWWTYTCHIKATCCPEGIERHPTDSRTSDLDTRPLLFMWAEEEPVIGSEFVFFRDSILALLVDDQILQITGSHYAEEEDAYGSNNLGMARARQVLAVMAPQLDSSRFQLKSELNDAEIVQRDNAFTAIRFRLVTFNPSIQEIDDRVLIYFPFNSTNMVDNPEINRYMNTLVAHLNLHDDTVLFTGHSDAFGPSDSNYELGLWRASAMRDVLIEKGIDPARIRVESKGETEPIATNSTSAGAKMNRRVELELIKQP